MGRYARDADNDRKNGQLDSDRFAGLFDDRLFMPINGLFYRLKEEGLDTKKLNVLYQKASETSRNLNNNPLGDEVRAVQDELTNLAHQLPNVPQTIDN